MVSPVVSTAARELEADVAFICQLIESNPENARTLALCVDDQFLDNLEYKVAGTPCERVYRDGMLYHPKDVTRIYPEDRMLADWKAESYMGVAFYDTKGMILGHVGVLSTKPMKDEARSRLRLRELATQAAAEIERRNELQQ